MIEKITDQNLERYDSRLKEWCDRKFFEKGNYGKYQTTEEAGAVAFYPAPNTSLEGKVKFSFKETIPAEGVKGPNNPSTITGVSSVTLTHGCKNYVSLPYHTENRTIYDVEWTINDDKSVTAVGLASANSPFYFTGHNTTKLRLVPNRKYFLHGCPSGGSASTYYLSVICGTNSTYSNAYDYGDGAVFIPKTHDSSVIIAAIILKGYSANVTFRAQLEDGETGTSYDLVQKAVSTINLGDTYYGGSIDLTTGVMTVTHEGIVIPRINIENASGTEYSGVFNLLVYDLRTNNKQADVFSYNESSGFNSSNYFCNYYPWERSGAVANTFHVSANFAFLSISGSSVENARQNLLSVYDAAITNDNPISFVYPLATPFIVQLTPQQIKSLAQSDKYTPRLNTVYTDADSVQIFYLKSPIRDEYEKTQAILSLGGNS